jgi:hypothetical protein
MKTFQKLREDGVVAVNNVGSGNIAGVGVGPQGEPGGPKSLMFKKKKKIDAILSRKTDEK